MLSVASGMGQFFHMHIQLLLHTLTFVFCTEALYLCLFDFTLALQKKLTCNFTYIHHLDKMREIVKYSGYFVLLTQLESSQLFTDVSTHAEVCRKS